MGLRINTNVAAMVGQRNIERTDRSLTKSLERLSSGLRINSAADDPAGLVVAEKQRAQIAGLNKALSNAERATSMGQTAEAALQEVNSLLVHMRELVLDSANTGYNDANAISANQAEIDKALASLDRIAGQTAFGGKKLFDGSAANQVLFADNTNTTMYATFGTSTLVTGSRSLSLYGETDASWAPENATLLTNMGFTNTLTGEQQDVSGLAAGAHVVKATQAATVSSISAAATLKNLAAAEQFKLSVKLADGSTVSSADIVMAIHDYSAGHTMADVITAINLRIALDATVGTKVEAYAVGAGVGFRTKSLGSGSYVAIAAPAAGATALGAGNLLSGFTAGDSSTTPITAVGTVGTNAIAYLDSYANTISYIEGDATATKTDATLLDAVTGGGSLKIQVSSTGLVVGNAIINVTAASGKAKLFTGAGGTGTGGPEVSWTADQAFTIADSGGKTLRATVGNKIILNTGTAGTTYENLTIQDNSLMFQVGGERLQTVSLSLLNTASNQLGKSISNTSAFTNLGGISVGTGQQSADALLLIDDAISAIANQRAEIGSFQLNTLESQMSNLKVAAENLTAARSTVVDTNFASTVADFSKQQILMQAGISVLANAGQMPQMVLKLLG